MHVEHTNMILFVFFSTPLHIGQKIGLIIRGVDVVQIYNLNIIGFSVCFLALINVLNLILRVYVFHKYQVYSFTN